MSNQEAIATAVAHDHPGLTLLVALRTFGWHGLPPLFDAAGICEVDAYLGWPNGWRDGLRIRGPGDALGIRINTDDPPGIVWEQTGGLVDVIAALLELPPPGLRFAPQLVVGLAPRLWLPLGGVS